MRLAIVYDWIDTFGGAERILLSLHEIWPEAPLYTSVYDPKGAPWAKAFVIKPSFLQKIPILSSRHEIFPLLIPYAFESFDFENYDVVLSVTSNDAKSIITRPNTFHICYCLTPTRYLWSGYQDYLFEPGFGLFNPFVKTLMRMFISSLRRWDFISSFRPDKYVAISTTVAHRIEKYYKKKAEIIYPPVEDRIFKQSRKNNKENYFIIVSRLVPYKKIDYVIAAFNKLGWQLKIVGSGADEMRLKSLSGKTIEFLGNLTDDELCCYYQNCKALIFPGEEDFGLAAVEAQACGKPVISYGTSGVAEIVIPGKTGEIYYIQNIDTLIRTLKKFQKNIYLSSDCYRNSIPFTKANFQKKITKIVENSWKEWRKRI